MYKKFVIFLDKDLKPYIVLAITDLHKNIKVPKEIGDVNIEGGGDWNFTDDGELILSGESADFGKYDLNMALEAFENKNVYYFSEPAFEEFNFIKIIVK